VNTLNYQKAENKLNVHYEMNVTLCLPLKNFIIASKKIATFNLHLISH